MRGLGTLLLLACVALAQDGAAERARAARGARKFDEARRLYAAAIAARGDADDPVLATLLNEAGELELEAGCPAAALPILRRALEMRRRLDGDDDNPDVAESLHNEGCALVGTGDLEQGTKRLREALAMVDRLDGDLDEPRVLVLYTLATALAKQECWADAHAAAERCVALARKTLSREEYRSVVGGLLGIWGKPEAWAGGTEAALPVLAVGAKLADEIESPERAGFAWRVGTLQVALGRPIEARETLLHAVALAQADGRRDDARTAQFYLGLNDARRGLHARAAQHLRAAYDLMCEIDANDTQDRAAIAEELAKCLHALGRDTEGLPLAEEAAAMRQRLVSGRFDEATELSWETFGHCAMGAGKVEEYTRRTLERIGEADTPRARSCYWFALASVHGKSGDLTAAIRYARRALEVDAAPEDARLLASEVLASYLGAAGEYDDAVLAARDVIELARSLRAVLPLGRFANLLLNAGDAFRAARRWEEYEALTAEVYEALAPLRHLTISVVAEAENARGNALCEVGRWEDALPHCRRAVEIYRQLASGGPELRVALRNLADCLDQLGEREEALRLQREAYGLAQHQDVRQRANAANALALLEFRHADYAAAADHAAEAVALFEELREEFVGTDEQRARYFVELRRSEPYVCAVRANLELGRAKEALRFLERARARWMLDLLAASRFDSLAAARRRASLGGESEHVAAIDAVVRAIDEGRRHLDELDRAQEVARADGERGKLDELGAQAARARRGLDDAFAERAAIVRGFFPLADPADPDRLLEALGDGEVLLTYMSGRIGTQVLLVTPEGLSWRSCGPGLEEMGRRVDAFRRAVAARGPARGVRVASGAAAQVDAEGALAELRVLIPPDLWPRIRKARRVILVPHGALDLIPFEALEVEPGKRWIEVGPPITYASSATHWYWCKRQRDAQRRRALPLDLLALGSTESGAAALAGTRRECEAAVSCFPKARALLDTEATRENLVQLAPRARLLHFATHGADASLVLTGGRLRLLDLLEDWRDMLSGCELVALSACETAVGQTYVHEGVFALPWGFHYAGAPSVIASLWRVDDASTAELFADFYARVEKGEAKLAAFTEARKALRKRYPDPYFWAPFVYIGDPR